MTYEQSANTNPYCSSHNTTPKHRKKLLSLCPPCTSGVRAHSNFLIALHGIDMAMGRFRDFEPYMRASPTARTLSFFIFFRHSTLQGQLNNSHCASEIPFNLGFLLPTNKRL